MNPEWMLVVIAVVWGWALVTLCRRIVMVVQKGVDRLTAIQNTQTLLFYAVEQMYEMSGVHERFTARKPVELDAPLKPAPGLDVSDPESLAAWSTLMQRVQDRVESVVRLRYRVQDEASAEDADGAMIRDQHLGWIARMPMLRGWPVHPHVCWWNTREEKPKDVPTFNGED